MVVDDDSEHVGRRAIRAKQHKVIEVFVLPDHAALDLIVDDSFAGERSLEPNHRPGPDRRILGLAVTAAAVIEAIAPFGPRFFAHGSQLFGTAVAMVGMARCKELFGNLTMTGGP